MDYLVWGVFEESEWTDGHEVLLALYVTEDAAFEHARRAQRDADMKGWPVEYFIEEWKVEGQ